MSYIIPTNGIDGSGRYVQLTTNGSHVHVVTLANQQVIDLIAGTLANVTVTSTVASSHTHSITVTYDSGTGRFGFVIANNHGHSTQVAGDSLT